MLEDANRCLLCKNAKCQQGCPINTPIPEVMKLYKNGEMIEAGRMLFENNPLSLICSMVCVHEDQCKGNCILNKKGNPVEFYKIETEISSHYFAHNKLSHSSRSKGKVAIIGGGPAGITISFILSQKGYDVTLFEAHSKIGGVLRYGIPEYRLPNNMVDLVEEKLIESGVRIRPNTLIGPVITLDRLFQDGYKAAFIGTGVWNPKPLTIKGETLGNVHYAIDYLKSPETYRLGESVVVIGAGNVALDAARSAIRGGASKVTIVYRKGFSEMPATDQEIKEALDDGISFDLYKYPIEIKDNGIMLGMSDKNDDKVSFIHADSTIIAISQTARNNIVRSTTELNTSQMGLIITDREGRTTKPGTFASGDVVTGAKTVVEAIAHAKVVAKTIDDYCQTLDSCILNFVEDSDMLQCEESIIQSCREKWIVVED
ncbi:NAD(P)-dependent oxidoreductase [Fusibacter bizertensis]